MTSRFIDTGDRYLNLDHVLAIRFQERKLEDPARGHKWTVTDTTFELADGDEVYSQLFEKADLQLLTAELVPATPGYVGLELFQPGTNEEWLRRRPVVAWRVVNGDVRSAVPFGYDDTDGMKTVLLPDGRVLDLDEGEWDTLADWLGGRRPTTTNTTTEPKEGTP